MTTRVKWIIGYDPLINADRPCTGKTLDASNTSYFPTRKDYQYY